MTPPPPVSVQVGLEPVHNALISLSLLHSAERLADADPWIAETAARMTPAQRERNRLIFEGLGEALSPDRDWPDFPSYLADLASQPPVALRDRMLQRISRSAPDATSVNPPDAARLLADEQSFVAQIARLCPNDPLDPALLHQVHALLNDPPLLQELIVTHLGALWERALASEWQRRLPYLHNMATTLSRRTWPAASADDAIRLFIGREPPAAISRQLDGVQRIVFVLSPHIGPHAARFDSSTTIWVFVRARAEELPLRQTPIKRIELVGPLSALADETRLQILELLAQHEQLLAQEIITRLDLSQSSISRHLKQLRATGFLIEQRGEGANKRYRLNPTRVETTFRALMQLLSSEPAPPETSSARDEQPLELRRFLDSEGRVSSWPAKRKDQRLVLRYLAARFAPEQRYTEREVNALLNQWHTFGDPATIRRDMYDDGLLHRTRDGGGYWRADDLDLS
jgi:biotin operon repressor